MKKIIALTLCSLIGGTALVAAAFTMSRFMLKIQQTTEKTITVKGVAEEAIVSDLGAFTCTIRCKAKTIEEGYRELNRITAILEKEFAALKISTDEIEDISIDYSRHNREIRYREANKSRDCWEHVFSHYEFSRFCRIRSKDVNKISSAVISLYALTGKGINITVSNPQYFITDPEQYKLKLIDLATASAYSRAKTVAENSGAELGALLSARQGVIQITRPASNDSSSGGVYDTSSINKVMRMVVTLEFTLK